MVMARTMVIMRKILGQSARHIGVGIDDYLAAGELKAGGALHLKSYLTSLAKGQEGEVWQDKFRNLTANEL